MHLNFTTVWYYGIQIKDVFPAVELKCGTKFGVKEDTANSFCRYCLSKISQIMREMDIQKEM
jgi:DNA-directed RNA polymerase subunit RPC12/RpoP